jgi:hypothetical protein
MVFASANASENTRSPEAPFSIYLTEARGRGADGRGPRQPPRAPRRYHDPADIPAWPAACKSPLLCIFRAKNSACSHAAHNRCRAYCCKYPKQDRQCCQALLAVNDIGLRFLRVLDENDAAEEIRARGHCCSHIQRRGGRPIRRKPGCKSSRGLGRPTV